MHSRGFSDKEVKKLVSHHKKQANSFRRQKDIISYIDNYYGGRDIAKIEKLNINFDLYNGRLDGGLLDDPLTIKMGKEEVNLEQNSITHFNFTSQIARAMHGEGKGRPFNPVALDKSPRAQSMRRAATHDLTAQYIASYIQAPLREKIFQEYMQEYGIQDVRQLTPEMQQQLQADIQQREQARTPSEIIDFMSNQFSTTHERGAQQMLDFLVEFLGLQQKRDDLFKYGIITGEEAIYIGERNKDVVFDILNPKHFTWSGSQHTVRYEKGDWGKYEEWFSVEAILQRHAMTLTKKDRKRLEDYIEPMGGLANIGNFEYDPIQRTVMYDLSDSRNPNRELYEKMNIGRREDNNLLMGMYANAVKKWGLSYGTAISNYGVRETRVAWRDKRKLKYVTRRNPNTGEKETYWLDEHYTPQPKDIEVKEVWLDEVWEGTKIGTFDDGIYTNIKPVTAQYKSIFDPFDVDLPFYGMAFNTHGNNSRNISPIDLGKTFQKEIDATMANIRFDMATDIGKVFMMDLSMKPENWTWQEFLDSIKTAKMAPINTNQSGAPVDAHSAKAIDMSRVGDIAAKLQYLSVLRSNLVQAMLFNDARIGSISEYATNTNTQANQNASYNQTEDLFDSHRLVFERALNGLVNKAKTVYKDQPHRHEVIFDDVTLAEVKANPDFWYEASGVYISLSTEDLSNVNNIKNLALTLSQNSMSPQTIVELSLAKTPSDIKSIMRKEQQRIQQAQQAQQQALAQEAQLQRQQELEDKQIDHANKVALQRMSDESKEHRSMLEASKFERMADVDNNKQADSVERAEIEDERKRDEAKANKELKEKELALKEREVAAKEKQVKTNNNK